MQPGSSGLRHVFVLLALPVLASSARAGSTLSWKGALALEQGYDSNVFLQSQTALADRGSWVTTIAPQATLTWKPGGGHRRIRAQPDPVL